jgi:hypothetical protein
MKGGWWRGDLIKGRNARSAGSSQGLTNDMMTGTEADSPGLAIAQAETMSMPGWTQDQVTEQEMVSEVKQGTVPEVRQETVQEMPGQLKEASDAEINLN